MLGYKLRPSGTAYLAVIALFLASFLSYYAAANTAWTSLLSAPIIITISMASWFLFSSVLRGLRDRNAVLIAAISGTALAIPSLSTLGPMSWSIAGVTAGFAAFALRGMMPSKRGYLAVSVYAAYFGLLMPASLASQTATVWDAGDGIGAWTGTAEPPLWNFEAELYIASISGLAAAFAVIRRYSNF